MSRLKVLYFCEGFTDIRFVVGLSERCDLTLATPTREFRSSGLAERIAYSGARLNVDEIPGGRPAFQLRSLRYLLRRIRDFDVVLSQGTGRGSLNSTVAGAVTGVPVVTYETIPPLEYWRCRRERRQIGAMTAMAGEAFLRMCMSVSGRLATAAIGLGPYLAEMTGRYSKHPAMGYYYGIDTALFKPVDAEQRATIRERHGLPLDRFLILFASRVSHEKDPETVLLAAARVRERGLDAAVLNLGGGHGDFVAVARRLGVSNVSDWVIGRPAVHPMKDLCEYFQAADVVVQASLEEGLGMTPLEALACETPVIATCVGGLTHLNGVAQLTPRRDVDAMVEALLWVANHPEDARAQAAAGRRRVEGTWSRERAFTELFTVLETACGRPS